MCVASQVDVDQCPEIGGGCGISSMPTFILFEKGREIARTTGADVSKLRDMLQRATYVFCVWMSVCVIDCESGWGAVQRSAMCCN